MNKRKFLKKNSVALTKEKIEGAIPIMTLLSTRRIFLVVLSCVFLLSGCTTGKLGGINNGTTGDQTAAQQTTQMQASGDQSNNVSPEVTANTSGETSAEATNTSSPALKVKALYLTGWTVGGSAKVQHYIDVAKNTEINSYVVDIKDDDGMVGYKSQIPAVVENGTWEMKYNVDTVIKAFHDNGVHIIGRIVCFKDPVYSIKRPDLAVKNISGGLWKDNKKKTWLNPYNKDNWAYLASIAKEAVEKGFDEIQLDYVRFPSDGDKKKMDFSGTDKEKYQAIDEFLAYMKSELPGVIISADVFGIIMESPADTEQIGQYLENVGKDIDYISPMVYPSHYASGQIVNKVEFPAPDLEPYKVVYNALVK
jgi:hypothetical protein